jgi:hypothetical protein
MPMSDGKKWFLAFLGACVLLVLFVVAMHGVGSREYRRSKPSAEATRDRTQQREAAEFMERARQSVARREAEAARERDAEEAAWLETAAGGIWQEHQDWTRDVCRLIATRQVRLGFSEQQCIAAWGQPDGTRRSINPGNTTTLLCYGDFCKRALYFVDDRLLRIEQ